LLPNTHIQRFLSAWFEASNSTVTKALRSMACPPLKLVKVMEHPRSAREKNIVLTHRTSWVGNLPVGVIRLILARPLFLHESVPSEHPPRSQDRKPTDLISYTKRFALLNQEICVHAYCKSLFSHSIRFVGSKNLRAAWPGGSSRIWCAESLYKSFAHYSTSPYPVVPNNPS
jgi:hypothetical protein